MNVPLPDSIASFFEVSNGAEASALEQCFTENAVVQDESLRHQGRDAIRAWLLVRGLEPGPLFHRMDRSDHGLALSGESVRRMLATRAREAGVKVPVRPHGLRHAAASQVAKRGSLAELRAIGQWKSLSSIEHYLDREDADRVAAMALVEL